MLTECADTNKDHKCDVCGKVLTECADTNKDHKCDVCGKVLTDHEGGTATCTKKAVCSTCGKEYGDVDKSNHSGLKKVDAKKATTKAEGNIEYWHCSDCGKYFSDAAATKEISQADTVIPKKTGNNTKPDNNTKPGNNTSTGSDAKKDDGKTVKSGKTGDAGIVLYAAMGLLSLTGGAWIVGKRKKED